MKTRGLIDKITDVVLAYRPVRKKIKARRKRRLVRKNKILARN